MAVLLSLCCLLLGIIDMSSATCHYSDDVCEFYLYIENQLTMMDFKTLVVPKKGKLYSYKENDTSTAQAIPMEKVISADGYTKSRVVTAVNNSLPGPPIIVYHNQTVIIHVLNNLTSNGVTVHWHGLTQRDTPWMDGVAFITQCPIMPGQSFTYKFQVTQTGTYWYHSHIGAQRSMGLYGALIIREKKPLAMEEHIFTIQDYNHDWDSELGHMKMKYGIYENRKLIGNTKSIEGAHFSMFTFQSGLINGRGRYHDQETGTHNEAPLSVFKVVKGQQYRFRMIGTGTLYPFRVSVDEHNLTVVASDGSELEPVVVESIIINPGERFDFILTADKTVSNYWIRAETLEVDFHHRTEAILRYSGAPEEEPFSAKTVCSESNKCLVLNCPFSYYPPKYHSTCITFDQLQSKRNDDPAVVSHTEHGNKPYIPPLASIIGKRDVSEQARKGPTREVFLNFAFPGKTWTPGSINGAKFKFPPVSALTQGDQIESKYLCPNSDCGEDKVCYCFNTLNLNHKETIQMVFLNMGLGKGWAHPIHMHGHSFQVLKMGYAQYDSNGQIIGDNMDIDCHGNPNRNISFCNAATWADKSWGGNNIPGLELTKPPRKDTIIVPSGGYVVVRIKADNPGMWFMHCHIELHNLDGMAMVINESYPHIPPPPQGFPVCDSYPPSSTKTSHSIHRREAYMDEIPSKRMSSVKKSYEGVYSIYQLYIQSISYKQLQTM